MNLKTNLVIFCFVLNFPILISCASSSSKEPSHHSPKYKIVESNNYNYEPDSDEEAMVPSGEMRSVLFIVNRFKEKDLSFISNLKVDEKHYKTSYLIYNKGDKIDPHTLNQHASIIDIPNLGWDSYGFLKYVIENYDHLPDFIFLIHASAPLRPEKAELMQKLIEHGPTSFYAGQIHGTPYNFTMDSYTSYTKVNVLNNCPLVRSATRPFGKWYENTLSKSPIFIDFKKGEVKTVYLGMFVVSKTRLLKWPLKIYESMFKEIQVCQSEVNHYLERSWYSMFATGN